MKNLLLSIALFSVISSKSQTPSNAADSIANAKQKAFEEKAEKLMTDKGTYPLIKSKMSGVIPVSNIDEKVNANQQYNLVIEITNGIKDSIEAKKINNVFEEVGRLINIHLAAGVPKKNIHVVVVAHGGVLKSFYNNEMYMQKYHTGNPNIPVFKELQDAGVKFVVCGQAMAFLDINKSQLFPWANVALSAASSLADYQLRGYVKIVADR